MSEAIIAGGCFWCVEAVFQSIDGVSAVESGYIGGANPNPTYKQVCGGGTGHAEAIKLTFDPAVVSLAAMVLLSGWAWEYVGADRRVAFFAGVGAAQMLFGVLSANRERTITGAVYAAAGLVLYWTGISVNVSWLDLVTILVIQP